MRTRSITDTGREREVNEDTVLVESLPTGDTLLVVADGMGGHQAGDTASQTATIELREYITRTLDDNDPDIGEVLTDAVMRANEEIQHLAEDNPELAGMGTTVVAAIVADETATLVNVGDSRGYLLGDTIEQITDDHNVAAELVASGDLSEAEAADHPQRHVLTQVLGTDGTVSPDQFECELDGQTLLLCSDGLTEELSEREIHTIITEADVLVNAAETLVDRANENGGSDNISIVLGTNDDGYD
jgi:protein phosphatase